MKLFCKHKYDFIELDTSDPFNPFFIYECEKCGKIQIIFTETIEYEINDVYPTKCMKCCKDELWLPVAFAKGRKKLTGRNVGYIVSKYYNKYGILLTAWGNKMEEEQKWLSSYR